MHKIKVLTTATVAVLAMVILPVFAYLEGDSTGGDQTATKEQLKECKDFGIPEFACTQQTILAKERVRIAQEVQEETGGNGGSGTALLGDMTPLVTALGVIFGGVAVAFFTKSKIGNKVPI